MALKTDMNAILSKKMDRKDFLKHVAIGVVALTGIGTLARTLAPSRPKESVSAVPQGYGASAYGGKKTS